MEVLALLGLRDGAEESEGIGPRVQLAILKLSDGRVDAVREHREVARTDFRDVIAPAEYPEFWQVGFVGVAAMTPAETETLKARDWHQYEVWLTAE